MTKEHKYMFLAGWQSVSFNPRRDIKLLSSNKRYFLIGMVVNFIVWLIMLAVVLFTILHINDAIGMLLYIAMTLGQLKIYDIEIPTEYTWKGLE